MELPMTINPIAMQTQGFSPVQFGSDALANVVFYNKNVLDRAKSQETGRPIYSSEPYVRIQHPGETTNILDRPLREMPEAPQRWPSQWMRFQKSEEQIPDGTPVEALFPQNPEIAANLHSFGVHTIEQMANMGAEGLAQVGMGATQWQQKAKQWLGASSRGVEFHQMECELEKRDIQIETLSNQVTMLMAQVQQLTAEKMGHAQHSLLSVQATAPIAAQAAQPLTQLGQTQALGSLGQYENLAQAAQGYGSMLGNLGMANQATTQPQSEPKKAKGWPKGKPRGPRKPATPTE